MAKHWWILKKTFRRNNGEDSVMMRYTSCYRIRQITFILTLESNSNLCIPPVNMVPYGCVESVHQLWEVRPGAQHRTVCMLCKKTLNPIRHQGSKPAPIIRFSLSAALIILVWKFAGDRLCYCSAHCGSSQSTGKVDRARVFCGRHPPLHLVCQTV